MKTVFSKLYGQCTISMQQKFNANPAYQVENQTKDRITMRNIIRIISYGADTKKHPTTAFIESEERLMKIY